MSFLRRRAGLILMLICVGSIAKAQSFFGSQPFIQNYTTKEFQTIESQVWSITSDHIGRLIFGHNNGALIFNGNEWQTISLPNKSFVRSVLKGTDSLIYIGGVSEFGYLQFSTRSGYKYHSLMSGVNDTLPMFNDVWDIFETPQGIVFNTSEAFFIYRDGKLLVETPPNKGTRVFKVGDELIYQYTSGGLCTWKGGSNVILPGTQSITDLIRFVDQVDDHTWMMGLDDGQLLFYDIPSARVYKKPGTRAVELLLKKNRIYCEEKVADDLYAIGTFYDGILFIDAEGRLMQHINNNSGLCDNMVYDIYRDAAGNVWSGLNLGISYILINSPLTLFDKNSGLISGASSSYVLDDELLIGTMSGTYVKKEGEQLALLPGTLGPTGNMIPINGGVCFSHYSGVFYYKNGQLSNDYDQITRSILKMVKPEGMLLGSTIGEGLALFQIGEHSVRFLHTIDGFDDQSPFLAQDSQGAIWMSKTNTGVYRLMLKEELTEVAETQFFNEENGLPANTGNRVTTLHTLSTSPQVLFCTEKGIYAYQENEFRPFEYFKTWLADTGEVKFLTDDEQGNIFVQYTDHNGLLKKKGADEYELIDKPFLKFHNISTESISSQDSCNVQFATDEGLYNYNMCHDDEANSAYRVILTHFQINNKPAYRSHPDKVVTLSSDSNNVKFKYAALYYEQHDETQYAYWLEGFDKEWSAWDHFNEKEYTNLPAGTYVFRVRARNVYQTEEALAPLHIKVLPPWHQTIWAYFFYFLGVVMLGWVAVKWRINTLEAEKEYLERVVEEKTTSIVQQKEEIEAQSEKLQEANDMKDKLFSIIAHDLRSPINSLSGLLKLAENGALTEAEFKNFIPSLSQNVNANSQLLHNLLHWSKSQLKNEQLSPEVFDVSTLIHQNIQLFKSRADEKGIALTYKDEVEAASAFADKAMIDLVIRNLIANAVKFTRKGGTIQVWVEHKANEVCVHVKDSGEGISEENVQKIFGSKMFSTRGTSDEKGTGLGLKLCKEFVNKNGGDIHLWSKVGEGSDFYFTLPTAQ